MFHFVSPLDQINLWLDKGCILKALIISRCTRCIAIDLAHIGEGDHLRDSHTPPFRKVTILSKEMRK